MPIAEEPRRPEPDLLLAEAIREGRGRLKVYLGMAPGVGKTFEMLAGARRLAEKGVDVVVGIVETHGRSETEALLAGLEILPRRVTSYRGHELHEFDIDAALARRPQLLLVDELAHTNAPDCRHPKRWQDVEELIKAGIDVHTTLNIQHLESLNDIVARITGIRVQETLPDRVVEDADDVELIDLTPEELVARLTEGKVYAAALAGHARERFFRPGNLAALRQLALRRTAESVDDQMVDYMRTHAIEGPWPVSERLMACVGADDMGPSVVRAASRMAEQLNARWVAVHIETSSDVDIDQTSVDEALMLAQGLQGRTERLVGDDMVAEILRYARRHNITQILIGRSRGGWWREVMRRSLVHELVRRSEGIAVHVITPPSVVGRRWRLRLGEFPDLRGAVTAIAGVLAVVVVAFVIPDLTTQPNVSMLFLAAVLFSAVRHGHTAALLAAVLSFLAYNFFFTEPNFTFHVSDWRDVLTLVVFLAVASTTGLLAGRVRDQVGAARTRMNSLRSLYDFSRRVGAAKTADELLHAVVLQAHRLTALPAMMLLPEEDDLAIRYAWPPEDTLDPSAWAAARWALKHGEPTGAHTGTLPVSPWHFRPMRSAKGPVGVLGVGRGVSSLPIDLVRTLDAMLELAAVAVERIAFAEEASRAAAMAETEKFRAALLSSISHDLRTPLTAILGSVTALRRDPGRYDFDARDDLLSTIQEESERLDRFVTNLLDITRLEAGALEVKRDWLVVSEVIDSALRRVARQIHHKRVVRAVAHDLPMMRGDFVLLETVLINLLDNAVKHAIDASAIQISAGVVDQDLFISVTDDGVGISSADLPHLFDKFYRIRRTDHAVAGTGIGLAIAKGLTETMGGMIAVQSPVADARGTRFTVHFPVEAQPVTDQEG